eukprot:CAMPEP_0184860318 /NCGR_PEP_ID=MMETSP0580-20130426/5227_1 /TAXON_ID=1118495 /ORGANISM="Dactyliosolen fragilissimus" /LENGTH=944 /DNA_ID=CAMNT_0027357383 /DNA_START=57 /DNA_END=2891 /DNA_ORIENTATION=-
MKKLGSTSSTGTSTYTGTKKNAKPNMSSKRKEKTSQNEQSSYHHHHHQYQQRSSSLFSMKRNAVKHAKNDGIGCFGFRTSVNIADSPFAIIKRDQDQKLEERKRPDCNDYHKKKKVHCNRLFDKNIYIDSKEHFSANFSLIERLFEKDRQQGRKRKVSSVKRTSDARPSTISISTSAASKRQQELSSYFTIKTQTDKCNIEDEHGEHREHETNDCHQDGASDKKEASNMITSTISRSSSSSGSNSNTTCDQNNFEALLSQIKEKPQQSSQQQQQSMDESDRQLYNMVQEMQEMEYCQHEENIGQNQQTSTCLHNEPQKPMSTASPVLKTRQERDKFQNSTNELNRIEKMRRKRNSRAFGNRYLFNGPIVPKAYENREGMDDGMMMKNIKSSLYSRRTSLNIHQGKGNNILAEILKRSNFPKRLHEFSVTKRRPNLGPSPFIRHHAYSNLKWAVSKTVQLNLNDMSHDLRQSEITCLEFDSQGVLMATSDSLGNIRIFDFDEINAIDMKKRNLSNIHTLPKQKQKQKQKQTLPQYIQPIVVFKVKCTSTRTTPRISCLKWNPMNEDQLVVSFFNLPEIHLYDVASSNKHLPIRLRCQKRKRSNTIDPGNKTLAFLPSTNQDHILLLSGGMQGTLSLWKLKSPSNDTTTLQVQAKLVWTTNPWLSGSSPERIDQIIHLPSSKSYGLVLVAGNKASISIIDTCSHVRKAFSTDITPHMAGIWNLLPRQTNPPSSDLGISKIILQGNPRNTLHKVKDPLHFEHKYFDITVIFQCGWILQAQLEGICKKEWKFSLRQSHFVHKSPKVTYFDSTGDELQMDKPAFSLPAAPVPAECFHNSSTFCFAGVRPMCFTLPDKDSKTVVNVESIQRSFDEKNANGTLIFMDHFFRLANEDSSTCEISFPNAILKQIAIHPHDEWMIIGLSSLDKKSSSLEILHQFGSRGQRFSEK